MMGGLKLLWIQILLLSIASINNDWSRGSRPKVLVHAYKVSAPGQTDTEQSQISHIPIPGDVRMLKWDPVETSMTQRLANEYPFLAKQPESGITNLRKVPKVDSLGFNVTSYTAKKSKTNSKRGYYYHSLERGQMILRGHKLFVSIASISSRVHMVAKVVKSILTSTLTPTHIFLFISREPHLLDKGIPPESIPLQLQYLMTTGMLSIIYTDNIGPHRKLLPLLQRYWEEDVLIVTFDDDKSPAKDALYKLVDYYNKHDRKVIVGLRVRRIGLCQYHNPQNFAYYKDDDYGDCNWPRSQNGNVEMLVLPTGTGGVLYNPKLLHPIIFDPELRKLTNFNDDLTFRLAALVKNTPVVNGCCTYVGKCKPPMMKSEEQLSRKKNVELYDRNQILNSRMWREGVEYLTALGLLDMDSIYKRNVHERGESCLNTTTKPDVKCGVRKCS